MNKDEQKKYILVIEDDKFYCNIFQTKFTQAGYDILVAFNGNLGIQAAAKRKPDLILLDLIMPEKDGFETLKELKADPTMKEVPIVVLSNLGQVDDIEKAKALGANDYIVKANISLQGVIEKVQQYLG